jgi:hypothetical protein
LLAKTAKVVAVVPEPRVAMPLVARRPVTAVQPVPVASRLVHAAAARAVALAAPTVASAVNHVVPAPATARPAVDPHTVVVRRVRAMRLTAIKPMATRPMEIRRTAIRMAMLRTATRVLMPRAAHARKVKVAIVLKAVLVGRRVKVAIVRTVAPDRRVTVDPLVVGRQGAVATVAAATVRVIADRES